MKTTITILSILAILCASTVSFAKKSTVKTQSRKQASNFNSFRQGNASNWKFGLDLVLNKSIYSDDNGTGSGAFSTGFFAVADHRLNNTFGLTFKFGYVNTRYNAEPLPSYEAAVSMGYITVSGLVRYQVDNNFSFAAGPLLAIVAGDGTGTITRNSSMRGLGSRNTPSSSQSAQAIVRDNSSTHYGLALEGSYAMAITNTITFEPSVGYDLFIGHGDAPKSDINGSWNNLHLNAGVRFAF